MVEDKRSIVDWDDVKDDDGKPNNGCRLVVVMKYHLKKEGRALLYKKIWYRKCIHFILNNILFLLKKFESENVKKIVREFWRFFKAKSFFFIML